MLVLGRGEDESIMLYDQADQPICLIKLCDLKRHRARLGFVAGPNVQIFRVEVAREKGLTILPERMPPENAARIEKGARDADPA
jgi:sRNA-binding carbon storage regulator CsrA